MKAACPVLREPEMHRPDLVMNVEKAAEGIETRWKARA